MPLTPVPSIPIDEIEDVDGENFPGTPWPESFTFAFNPFSARLEIYSDDYGSILVPDGDPFPDILASSGPIGEGTVQAFGEDAFVNGRGSSVGFHVDLEMGKVYIPDLDVRYQLDSDFNHVAGTYGDDLINGNEQDNILSTGQLPSTAECRAKASSACGPDYDTLNGRGGDDILIGGAGIDQLTGGSGEDVFVLGESGTVFYTDTSSGDYGWGQSELAKITDFNSAEDTIQLAGSSGDYLISTNAYFGCPAIVLDSGTSIGVLDSEDDLIALVAGDTISFNNVNFV